MSKNGKDKFYKYLNLDEESKTILKWYKKTVKQLLNDEIKDKKEEDDS